MRRFRQIIRGRRADQSDDWLAEAEGSALKLGSDAGFAYVKFNRRAQDWATVGVAAVRVDGEVHVALTSMGATPLRATAVEQALASGAAPGAAAEHAAEGTEPPSDTNGSSEYRGELAKVLVRRALDQTAGS